MPLNRSERQGLIAGMLAVVLALVAQCWLEPLSGWQFAVAGIVITFGGAAAVRGFTRGWLAPGLLLGGAGLLLGGQLLGTLVHLARNRSIVVLGVLSMTFEGVGALLLLAASVISIRKLIEKMR